MARLHPTTLAPHVSVVVPAYNAARYIAATLRSALDQSGLDVEILVIDDGSTDQTVAEVSAISHPRITVISSVASGGPSRPRNIGIWRARAPYVSLLDADDILKPGKLASSVAALDRCPSAGFAFNDFERMDEHGNVWQTSAVSAYKKAYPELHRIKSQPIGDGWRLIPQTELARGLSYANFIGTSGVVMRKDLVMTLGAFDEALLSVEDLDLWFRLAHRCDALYTPKIGHSYRMHAGSLITAPPIGTSMFALEVLRRETPRSRDREARRQLNRRIARNLFTIGHYYRLKGERWRAVRSYARAFEVSPDKSAFFNGLLARAMRRNKAAQALGSIVVPEHGWYGDARPPATHGMRSQLGGYEAVEALSPSARKREPA